MFRPHDPNTLRPKPKSMRETIKTANILYFRPSCLENWYPRRLPPQVHARVPVVPDQTLIGI